MPRRLQLSGPTTVYRTFGPHYRAGQPPWTADEGDSRMQYEPLVMVIDEQAVFDQLSPILKQELATENLVHFERREDALALIRAGTRVDFIFCAWGAGSAEFVAQVRHGPQTHKPPVVVLASADSDDTLAAATRAGASEVLIKPLSAEPLGEALARLKHLTDHRRRRRARLGGRFGLTAGLGGGTELPLELLDLSIEGCRARAAGADFPRLPIYASATLQIRAGDEAIRVAGEVIRVEHDFGERDTGDTILVTFEFTDAEQADYVRLQALIDGDGEVAGDAAP